MALILIVAGAFLVAFGVGLVFVPAGVIVAGGELIAGGYVAAYMTARRAR